MIIGTIDHIVIDDKRVARIKNSRIKVIHLVMDKLMYDWTPEAIQQQYPHLSLGEIHAAFAYYYDHKEELDQQIKESYKKAEALHKLKIAFIVDIRRQAMLQHQLCGVEHERYANAIRNKIWRVVCEHHLFA